MAAMALASATGIGPLLHPTTLSNLKGEFSPVRCRLWRGGTNYESFDLEPYPFDTLNTLKQMIYANRGYDPAYLPRFLFVGIRRPEGYEPLDYFWFPIGSNLPSDALLLLPPQDVLQQSDTRFVTPEGTPTGASNEPRGRILLEVLAKGEPLEIDVFPLSTMMRSYGTSEIPVDVWNGRFAPYFPGVLAEGPYRATPEDKAYGMLLQEYLRLRDQSLRHMEDLFAEQPSRPPIDLTGIRQLRLSWPHNVDGFEGAASLFYQLPATPMRPFLRLLPSEGTPVTKLHVQGVIPIPTLEDPRVLDVWGKEQNQTPGYDTLMIKYVQRPSMAPSQPLYGTIEVFQEGTMRMTVQPPKSVRKLDPAIDFRTIRQVASDVFRGLPQPFEAAQLGEASVQFTVRLTMEQSKFTTARLQQRIAFFTPFFTVITPPTEESPLIALRYKAVNQYVTENKVFAYITQRITLQRIEDRDIALADGLQREFQMTRAEAEKEIADWYDREGKLSVVLPEDDEFVDRFHPGIDLYIYSNHPLYTVNVNRVDSYESYERIYTLLSMLFLHDDTYFEVGNSDRLVAAEQEVEQEIMKIERPSAVAASAAPAAPAAVPSISAAEAAPNPAKWYLMRLQSMDKKLFPTTQSSASGARGYTSQCQSNNHRQPVVLSEDQYQRMRMVYEWDSIHWIIYPIEGETDPVKPLGTTLTITIMRYGSDSDHIFYYFCPEYFCIHDDIMVLAQDFEAIKDRQGQSKPENSCPFCHGGLIAQGARTGQKGKTVLRRGKSYAGNAIHSYIQFLKKGASDTMFMPCCFITQKTLRLDDSKFDHLRTALKQKKVEALLHAAPNHLESEEEEEEETDEHAAIAEEAQQLVYRPRETIQYAVLMETIHRGYILEANKTPAAGKFAMAPSAFDAYFRQNSAENLISRTLLHPKLRPTAQGFLRIGVENTYYESLLGALAPILYRTSIAEVKQRILEVVVPRVFLNSHFGNLVLEFYQPMDNTAMPITEQELRIWSQTNLQIAMSSSNRYALMRIYNAYHRFVRFIEDTKQRKDLRHLQPLLAEPGLFTANGIQLILLNDNGQGAPTVQCPVFGVSIKRHKRNDMVFLSRSLRTMGTSSPYAHYELYLHTSNRPEQGQQVEKHETILRWDYASQRVWPQVVQDRVMEYLKQCQSRYETMYTAQPMGDAAVIPLSKALENAAPEGIVKDAYNHIVGVTYRSNPRSSTVVVLPVVDDGVVTISSAFTVNHIYLDYEDIPAAPIDEVVQYYKTLTSMLLPFPGYAIKRIVRVHQQIAAVQLANGMYVPCRSAKKQQPELPIADIDEFPWQLEARIHEADATTCGKDPELLRDMSVKDMEEIYQQFRMMVSNWITTTPSLRRDVEAILFQAGLPEYERRKRMWIYLSTTLLEWLDADAAYEDKQADSFLRKDCRVIDSEDNCTGTCRWSSNRETGEGRCLLHVPTTYELGSSARKVSLPMMFTRRVIDELVRFPARRRQLMERGGISSIKKMMDPVRSGDQYVIPESSPSWTTLLQLEWTKKIPEKHQYYEEWSRSEDRLPQPPSLGEVSSSSWLEDSPYHVMWFEDDIPVSVLGVSMEDLQMDESFGRDQMVRYVRLTQGAIGYIYGDNVQFAKPFGYVTEVMLLIFEEGRMGVVIEEEGKTTISIAHMPPHLAAEWEKAKTVLVKHDPIRLLKGEKALPLVAQKMPIAPPILQSMMVPSQSGPKMPVPKKKMPAAPSIAAMEDVPALSAAPAVSFPKKKMPAAPSMAAMEDIPALSAVPSIAAAPSIAAVPSVAAVSASFPKKKMPAASSMAAMEDIPALSAAPSVSAPPSVSVLPAVSVAPIVSVVPSVSAVPNLQSNPPMTDVRPPMTDVRPPPPPSRRRPAIAARQSNAPM